MKRLIVNALILVGTVGVSSAQNFRLNAYSAYTINDKVDSYYSSSNYYDGTIKGGFQWGAGFEYMVRPAWAAELKYLHQDASVPMFYYYGSERKGEFNLGMNYILLGANRYFKTANEKIEPYLGAGIGIAMINIKNPISNANSDINKFAFNLKAGTNIWVTKRIGIKLEVNLLSAIKGASNGFYFEHDIAGIDLTSYKTIMQLGFGGGLTYRIGK